MCVCERDQLCVSRADRIENQLRRAAAGLRVEGNLG